MSVRENHGLQPRGFQPICDLSDIRIPRADGIRSTLSYLTCQRTHTWRPLFRHHPLQIMYLDRRSQGMHHLRQLCSKGRACDDEIVAVGPKPCMHVDASPLHVTLFYVPGVRRIIFLFEDEDERWMLRLMRRRRGASALPTFSGIASPATAPLQEETEPFGTDESCWPHNHLPCNFVYMTAGLLFPEPFRIALGPRYEVGESSAAAAARPAGGFRADYGFVATMDREIRRDPERYVGYGITDSWDEIVETLQGAPVSTDTELGAHMREFESMVRRIPERSTLSGWSHTTEAGDSLTGTGDDIPEAGNCITRTAGPAGGPAHAGRYQRRLW
ncbi:hypothetical protein Tco_0605971 [Tanacetum coccineum]